MDLKVLLNQGRLRRHKTSKEEINNLLALVEKEIKDAKVETLFSRQKVYLCYNAILQLATILL